MRKILFTAIFCACTFGVFAQKIKFKKDKILVDNTELVSFSKGGAFGSVSYELTELGTNKRIITLIQYDGGTHMELSDDYTQIKFLTNGEKAEISGGDLREAIKLLLKNEVLTKDGKLDETKIELFVKNYDEKITDRTVINRY